MVLFRPSIQWSSYEIFVFGRCIASIFRKLDIKFLVLREFKMVQMGHDIDTTTVIRCLLKLFIISIQCIYMYRKGPICVCCQLLSNVHTVLEMQPKFFRFRTRGRNIRFIGYILFVFLMNSAFQKVHVAIIVLHYLRMYTRKLFQHEE